MNKREILHWLHQEDVNALYAQADACRQAHVGDQVHLRGLIEISNHCGRTCLYCGLRAANAGLGRYRMSREEILDSARLARMLGYGSVVLQSGEDFGLTGEFIADVVTAIKSLTGGPGGEVPLAVTLSLGERSDADLLTWRQAGADRYLLRFETSNPMLFRHIHPSRPGGVCGPGGVGDRVSMLRRLREMGYEIGSGVMIGVPGQTFDDLANDILLFAELGLDMIGVGPFLPHPHTPLGATRVAGVSPACPASILPARGGEAGVTSSDTLANGTHNAGETPATRDARDMAQVPNSEAMTYKTVALTRLTCPRANIPSTTALATLNQVQGRELGLRRGANVVMPNLTPPHYRRLYEIYPAKACLYEAPGEFHTGLLARLAAIGRRPGQGPGGVARASRP